MSLYTCMLACVLYFAKKKEKKMLQASMQVDKVCGRVACATPAPPHASSQLEIKISLVTHLSLPLNNKIKSKSKSLSSNIFLFDPAIT